MDKQLNKNEYLEYIKQWKEEHKQDISNGKCRHIFLECLPLNNYKIKNINWKNSINYSLNFIYEDIEGYIIIEDYIYDVSKLKIGYKEKSLLIDPQKLKMCQLGKLLNKISSDFKIEIGQIFKDNKRDLVIIDRKIEAVSRIERDGKTKVRNYKYYNYKCNVCGWTEGWGEESNFFKGIGCGCCSNQVVIKGINDVDTTNPELVKYFVNIEDVFTHCIRSNKKILMKCPDCGTEKEMVIYSLYKNGFGCFKCSDGVSYPEKFMINLLKQLKIKFIREYNPKWIKPKRYDFYFKLNNKEYIIEMDGELGHGNKIHGKSTKSLKQSIEDDKYKDVMANEHGIEVIRISCAYKNKDRFEHIKQNILNSKLNKLINLSSVNWIAIGQDSEKNLVKEICNYWKTHNEINNKNLTTTQIGNLFNLNRCTIREYLQQGTIFGWCNYDGEKEKNKSKSKNFIKVIKNNECVAYYSSIKTLEKESKKRYGFCFDHKTVSKICNQELNQYKGFTFEHITKEEFYNSIDNQNGTYELYP